MNNCNVVIKEGISKNTNKKYVCLMFYAGDILIELKFIKFSEIDYYTRILNIDRKEVN